MVDSEEYIDMDKYITGIYNYCDRWCERCNMTDKCFLFAKDQERIKEHLEKGEDPYDMEIVLKDVEKEFEMTFDMIREFAQDEGIDLENLSEDDYDEIDPNKYPLFQHAHRYFIKAGTFLERLQNLINDYGIDLSEKIAIFSETIDDVDKFKEVIKAYQIVTWYHTLILTKLYRALSVLSFSDEDDIDDFKEVEFYDSNGSAKVAYISILESIGAFQTLHSWFDEIGNVELQDDSLNILVLLDKLRKMVDSELPGHRDFKRPGFDD